MAFRIQKLNIEKITINTSQEVGIKVELLEGVNGLQPQCLFNLDGLLFVLHINYYNLASYFKNL